ncbi:protein tesmin/TSO1-like CXC 2 [Andrographis paniculata]|uniref:protein tesmin/TSO1-like CXC 2 n=1 Tax=Andrographis paniculata TaxID=175694 RepID=UPI0021E8DE6A|nr:protein tesmin/TSO1-like CXC 2 [Andrographis paniculata]
MERSGDDFGKERKEAMASPERSSGGQAETSIDKFEDSPIFGFINNLSPIKPLKSTLLSHSINPLSFGPMPSVFTSPQVNPLRECRILRRDLSKPEFSSGDGITSNTYGENEDHCKKPDEHEENPEPDSDSAAELSNECSKLVADFVENINRESSSRPGDCVEAKNDCSWGSSTFAGECSQSSLLTQVDSRNWGSLIPETSNPLTLESQKPVDPAAIYYRSIKCAVQNLDSSSAAFSSELSRPENFPARLGEETEIMEHASAAHDGMNSSEKMEYEQLLGFYRGVRRRCLVFEATGGSRNNFEENSVTNSSLLLQSNGNTSSNQQLALSNAAGNDFSGQALHGVGLHLNAIAATPNGYKIVNREAQASGRLLIGHSSSSTGFVSQTSNQVLFENDSVENGAVPVIDPCKESGGMPKEETNKSFQKKKSGRMETGSKGESCGRCNCKKSKCLKLYCECFAAGTFCGEPCACIECFNRPANKEKVSATRKQIESRNPLAFAPKVIRGSDSSSERQDDSSKTPASARHKRGCNCKKSSCLKKYCECYQGGVGCSINCRCEGCKNKFGRKNNVSSISSMDTESESEEPKAIEKDASDRPSKKIKIQNTIEPKIDSAPPSTPSNTVGHLINPFLSKPKLPMYPVPSICSLPGFAGFQKSSFFPSLPKIDQRMATVGEEEIIMPEFLQGVSPPVGAINSSSPNRKRISPPQRLGKISSPPPPSSSSGLRSNRKLILESIPSFPSLGSSKNVSS